MTYIFTKFFLPLLYQIMVFNVFRFFAYIKEANNGTPNITRFHIEIKRIFVALRMYHTIIFTSRKIWYLKTTILICYYGSLRIKYDDSTRNRLICSNIHDRAYMIHC